MDDDEKKIEFSRDKSDLSEIRTGWSEDRVLLSNERTFGSWMRTGMSSLVVGIGLQAVFHSMEPVWIAKIAASLFIAIAIMIFLIAAFHDSRAQRRINEHDVESMPAGRMWLIAVTLSVASLLVAMILWLS
ncbi:YidH family protein [Pontibaca methylaminivorans]|uniref:YidH family protein n=1 Tax=Pontibaca methylaminivorans TaxID=515897 RepID=UPI002FD909B6